VSDWRIVPTTRRTSKDMVDIVSDSDGFIAGYVQRHHAERIVAAVADHALGRLNQPARCTECGFALHGGERVTEEPIGSGLYHHADAQACEDGPIGPMDGGFC
jgi:hypothetical protein